MTVNILLIDDDLDMRLSTSQGARPCRFSCPRRWLRRRSDRPRPARIPGCCRDRPTDAGMDGMTLLDRLQDIDRDLPVILITDTAKCSWPCRQSGAERGTSSKSHSSPKSWWQPLGNRCPSSGPPVASSRQSPSQGGGGTAGRSRGTIARSRGIDHRLAHVASARSPRPTRCAHHGSDRIGKEVVARASTICPPGATRPFVVINCAGLRRPTLESELFGHEPGAFPGAMRSRFGRFEHARGGTILLAKSGAPRQTCRPAFCVS